MELLRNPWACLSVVIFWVPILPAYRLAIRREMHNSSWLGFAIADGAAVLTPGASLLCRV